MPARRSRADEVRRLVLTASGGPFRGRTRAELADVTADEALAHPTWDMGPLVTTNSSTLVNKGLEVIEAHLLFGIDFDRIDVVVHPQSVVHSMVEFHDGSTLAQASPPDMRLPIASRSAGPTGCPDAAPPVDWTQRARAGTSSRSTTRRSRGLGWPSRPGRRGGMAPAVYNAANEVCVEAFLDGDCPIWASSTQLLRCWTDDDVPSEGGRRDASTTCSPPTGGRVSAAR